MFDWQQTGRSGDVPQYSGSAARPGFLLSLVYLVFGGLIALWAAFFLVALPFSNIFELFVRLTFLIAACAVARHGFWRMRLWWDLDETISTTGLASRLGVTDRQLRQLAAERGVRPKLILNGQSMYAASDFEDIMSLLRPAEGEERTLLQPAGAAPPDPRSLLRIMDREASGGDPFSQDTAAMDAAGE
jgi:hypothetical protein